MKPITIKIDVTKIDNAALYKGAKGTYLNLVMWPNKDGAGQYGDTHFVVQELSQERREAGEKGPIVGNAKVPGGQEKAAPQARKAAAPNEDVPF